MINSIQYLRALAAWMVVLHHFFQIAFKSGTSDGLAYFFYYGAYGVDLFFVISGFVIYHSISGKVITFKQFMLQRIARIIPAYWFFTLLVAVLVIHYQGLIPSTAFSPLFLLKSLFFLPENNPSGIGFYPLLTVGWTLNYEMVFYFIVALTLILPTKFRLVATTLGLCLLIFAGSKLNNFSFYSNKMMLEFLFGVIVNLLWKKGLIQKIPGSAAIAFVILALLVIGFEKAGHHYLRTGIPCALIFTAVISQNHRLNHLWIIHLGNWSYSTYLCHVLILAALHSFATAFGFHSLFIACFGLPCIVIASYLSYTFIEKPAQLYFYSFANRKHILTTARESRSLNTSI
ncbi:acyltransferase family protein [Legionella hackeliae]|uniref:Putative Acyltransferase 3 n=1 Tax=Legionella hackeliae TaxID=449 RepID=A0A0A8UN05_LEGHA|nr:acyltransferase [Legionella hackeliae]KTD08832.1 acyltransferase [Legionella hackeliae]CEK10260.1 putative Acyltransferase 3 [Legionella hackeliae]STX46989.1 acyltransferase [Legionella hackeliae]